MELGYWLSSEEHAPRDLVANARAAEEAGFSFAVISDHFHPWVDAQGEASFVWSVLGGIAATTQRLTVGTGVTCPLIRIHPAIVAQAAELAGRIGDGYMNVAPDGDTLKTYEQAGGKGPKYGKVTGASSLAEAHERWPNMGLGGSLSQELALPRDFEAAADNVRPEVL